MTLMATSLKFILLCSFFCAFNSHAQNGYEVNYTFDTNDLGLQVNGVETKRPLSYSKFVFNDSFSYSYGMGIYKKDPYRKKKNYGSKVISKSLIVEKGKYEFYMGVNVDLKKPHYVKEYFKKIEWIFTEDTITILGYLCKKAYKGNHRIDSLAGKIINSAGDFSVWFTSELKCVQMPETVGVPGLILKSIYTTPHRNIVTIATSLNRQNVVIAIPKSIPILTQEQSLKKVR